MKMKKITALLLCTVMAGSAVLTGCGEKKEKAAAKSAADDVVDEDGKVNGAFYAEGLPLVDDDTTFSIFCDGTTPENGSFVMLEEFEKQTGVKLDLQIFPNETAKEKLNLALSSGDYADAIGGWLLTDADVLKYGVNQKIFIPLEDYIEKYAPNIQALLEMEGVRETMTAPDGHIYTIPYVNEAPLVDFSIFVNTRWLENVGMEMPTTTEEFKEVLKAFKEQDANGNGDPNDEIPLSFDPNNKNLGYLAGWFGVPVDKYGMTMDGDELAFGANTDAYKEAMKFLRELYTEGLIDNETFTQDLSQWKAKGAQDRFGAAMMYDSKEIISYDPGVVPDFAPLPVLKSPMCDTPLLLRDTYGFATMKTQVAITNKAENPGLILRWFDNVFELENSLGTNYGPMGICTTEKDGKYYQEDKTVMSEEDQEKYNWANLFPQSLPHYIPVDFQWENDEMYQEKDVADELYADSLTEAIPEFWVALDDIDEFADLQTSISDYITQKSAEWISGQGDIDAEWEEYCEQLDTLGLERYLEIRQNALEKEAPAEEAEEK